MLKSETHGNTLPKNFPHQVIFFIFNEEFWVMHVIQQNKYICTINSYYHIQHQKCNILDSLLPIFGVTSFPSSLLTKVPLYSKAWFSPVGK